MYSDNVFFLFQMRPISGNHIALSKLINSLYSSNNSLKDSYGMRWSALRMDAIELIFIIYICLLYTQMQENNILLIHLIPTVAFLKSVYTFLHLCSPQAMHRKINEPSATFQFIF